jgi:hypothetical protein
MNSSDVRFDKLMQQPIYAEYAIEGKRLFDAYISEYEWEKEFVVPRFVELHVEHIRIH